MLRTSTLVLLAMVASTLTTAQTLVGTAPQPRTALLEKFTAINCGNCPAASSTSNVLASAFGDDLVRINIHGGGLANPSASQPDFRTPEGAALWDQFDIFFQPQGMVNRQASQQANGWNAAIQGVLAEVSPVNIGVASSYDAGSQSILVEVELYYTGESAAGEDRIYVALTQDHITGYQQDYTNGAQPNYDHRHVLRDYFTATTGDPVTTTEAGTLVNRMYSLVVPATWNLADLDVVAFVGDANGDVHQVRSVDADGGATVSIGGNDDRFLGLGDAFPVPASDLVIVPFSVDASGGLLCVRDAVGRIVLQQSVATGATHALLPVAQLADGVYTYGFINGAARRLLVRH